MAVRYEWCETEDKQAQFSDSDRIQWRLKWYVKHDHQEQVINICLSDIVGCSDKTPVKTILSPDNYLSIFCHLDILYLLFELSLPMLPI